ncbi:MAG: phage holin family protein [Patescibacteria group bacterium]|nr:phage holin family protein [Patescibacteria group bacterium]
MTLILRWVINAIALLIATQLITGFSVEGFYYALIAALVLGLVNAVIRPLILILTLPINILTLGFFTIVINALLIWFVSTFLEGFTVTGFVPALLAAVFLWAVSILTNWFVKKAKK